MSLFARSIYQSSFIEKKIKMKQPSYPLSKQLQNRVWSFLSSRLSSARCKALVELCLASCCRSIEPVMVSTIRSSHSPPQDTASSSPAWAFPAEVLRDTPAEASFDREPQTAPCLGFEPDSCPLEVHSYWGCSWVNPCWRDSYLQGGLVGPTGS